MKCNAIPKALLGILCLVVSSAAQIQRPASNSVVAIQAGRLFDGKSGQLLSNQVVLINGDRISAVGSRNRVSIPSGAKVIDLSHATVFPGLIESHSHVMLYSTPDETAQFNEMASMPGGQKKFAAGHFLWFHQLQEDKLVKQSWQYRTIEAVVNAKKDLEAGFTTMRDLGTYGAMYSDVDVRHAINQGLILGPRLQVATRAIVGTTGGFLTTDFSPEVPMFTPAEVINSPDAARQAVREQVKYGASVIKIYETRRATFTPEGKLVSFPTLTLDEIKAVVDEAHRQGLSVACHAYGGEGLRDCIEGGVNSIEHGIDLDDKSIQMMVERGTYLVPTLYIYYYGPRNANSDRMASLHEQSFRKALARGVKIAFGSDVGVFPHGTQAKEFEYMVRFGMTPAQALLSATSVAAGLMGWQDRVGSIEPGKFADIDAVSGNPLNDITELERVKFVMKGGVVVRNDLK